MLKHVILACAAAFALSSAALAAPNTAAVTTPASASRAAAHSTQASTAEATMCRTHRHTGASCSCAKAPGRTGTSERQNGRNTCVVAAAHG
ncbi:MAG: hypothetical protein JNJ73_07230 [Hyphomonadaceae bacterium]|nr:hypothetical protein [Hyphomonadaceae bacterium]